MTNPNTPAGTVSAQKLAALLMISAGRVRQLAQEGVIPKAGRDAYPLVASIRGYLGWLADDARRSKQVEARVRVAEARAQVIEQQIAEKMRGLIPIEDARGSIAEVVRVVRAELGKVPDVLPSYVRDKARAEIEQSMSRIAKVAADAAKKAELGKEVF